MEELVFAKCDCCGLMEECTPAYIETIRQRYVGKWMCGLCGQAVDDEILRSQSLITTEEAVTRHINFCRSPNPSVHLIAAMRQILRRGPPRSMPNSPSKDSKGMRLSRSEACLYHHSNYA
ncbi:hypothetical protein L1987_53851 [Smallanthus sonchifolius]|uniref:Uncharacterized protein n=1 Tax=Smallanthus sonchifolius TaxID=185202 RepID=A0ACB9EWQ7_9ASTR|nr:hypothetical protein L1987_53851 [Smallanthus sonchifolius]